MSALQWKDVLNIKGYLINLDKCHQRLSIAKEHITNAGFTNVDRFRAVNGRDDDERKNAWERHGSPSFDENDVEFVDTFKHGKQGCALSHFNVWKDIIDNNIPYAIIFEDDIKFHKDFKTLAPLYWENTPKDFDILYLGSQLDMPIDGQIVVAPVYCTHAYMVTLEGVKKLYNLCLMGESNVSTIDCMINNSMKKTFATNGEYMPFKWYVWIATMFPDEESRKGDPQYVQRNTGLIFQDASFESDVRLW